MPTNPSATIVVREHRGQPFYEAMFRHGGRQIKRRIGPAWIERDADTGEWRPRRGHGRTPTMPTTSAARMWPLRSSSRERQVRLQLPSVLVRQEGEKMGRGHRRDRPRLAFPARSTRHAVRDHTFPLRADEPNDGFAQWAVRQWTDKGKDRHGPLFGVNDEARALIERCQPYQGGPWIRLRHLHDMWNTDKHQTLIPTMLMFQAATLKLTNALIQDRVDHFEGDTYVVEFTVAKGSPPPEPQVDVEPHAPTDIAFREGAQEGLAVIEKLRQIGKVLLVGLLIPASEIPAGTGVPGP